VITARVAATVQFYDLDPMQVVWHGHYPRFLEQARCALLDKIAFNYREMARTRFIWPIVDMRIKYVRPARFAQQLEIEATLVEYENRLKIEYEIRDRESGEVLTRAHTIQVAVDAKTGELEFASPAALVDAVRRHL
jgi:acyl-CoA thioester hydrolase